MSKREVTSAETGANRNENDEVVKFSEISESEISAADDQQIQERNDDNNESWFPDLKAKWRESDPLTAPRLSAARVNSPSWRTLAAIGKAVQSPSQQALQPLIGHGRAEEIGATVSHSHQNITAQALGQWFRSEMLAALPFHHLIPMVKLTAAFAAMPTSLVRPQTVGEAERRRQFFWQSLANSDVTAKEAALLDDSLHCRFNDFTAGRKIEIDWEIHYYDELQGCAEL